MGFVDAPVVQGSLPFPCRHRIVFGKVEGTEACWSLNVGKDAMEPIFSKAIKGIIIGFQIYECDSKGGKYWRLRFFLKDEADGQIDTLSTGLASSVGVNFILSLNLLANNHRLSTPITLAPEIFDGLDGDSILGLQIWSGNDRVRIVKAGNELKGLSFHWDERVKTRDRSAKEQVLLEYCQKLSRNFPDIPLVPPKTEEATYDDAPPVATIGAELSPAQESPPPLQYNFDEIMSEVKVLIKTLKWHEEPGKSQGIAHLKRNFGVESTRLLSDAQLIQFLNQLRLLVNPRAEVLPKDDIPF